ncbi:hypothetical protein M514_04281 [Trichuris suis]|uniref:Uncharacterized protein n=1 Tax=Trichuris suis TaxID=68888 RepID=A0A085NQH3_9BILA|nr:hypothetical protein M513_04281 [Trichuris suis]KFD71719.1 hypothetical protein M514_04281 [Trichuris suis]
MTQWIKAQLANFSIQRDGQGGRDCQILLKMLLHDYHETDIGQLEEDSGDQWRQPLPLVRRDPTDREHSETHGEMSMCDKEQHV